MLLFLVYLSGYCRYRYVIVLEIHSPLKIIDAKPFHDFAGAYIKCRYTAQETSKQNIFKMIFN